MQQHFHGADSVTHLRGGRTELLVEGTANGACVVDRLTIHSNRWKGLVDLRTNQSRVLVQHSVAKTHNLFYFDLYSYIRQTYTAKITPQINMFSFLTYLLLIHYILIQSCNVVGRIG